MDNQDFYELGFKDGLRRAIAVAQEVLPLGQEARIEDVIRTLNRDLEATSEGVARHEM